MLAEVGRALNFCRSLTLKFRKTQTKDRRHSYSRLSPSLCRPWESMLCLILLLGVWDRVSLYNPSWHGIRYVAQVSHKLPVLLLSLLRPSVAGIYQFYCVIVFVCFLKIGSHVAQASFELLITLPLPPENVGNHRCVPPHPLLLLIFFI